jgi:hypothetical protein
VWDLLPVLTSDLPGRPFEFQYRYGHGCLLVSPTGFVPIQKMGTYVAPVIAGTLYKLAPVTSNGRVHVVVRFTFLLQSVFVAA